LKNTVYRKTEKSINSCYNFELEGRLSPDNRWVIMAKLIPWSDFEREYASLFSEEMGAPAKSFRMALGSLIIKEKLGTSDIETVEQIRENPYLQYFIGLLSYNNEAPFDPSMLSHFRQRIGIDMVNKINELMVKENEDNQPKHLEAAEIEVAEKKTPKKQKKLS
jgi:transposase, IS5 family